MNLTPEQIARFWARFDKSDGPDACWLWQGSHSAGGYGKTAINGQCDIYTHRLAYELSYGPIPPGQFVCHRCDNPPCGNPAHLWLGTNHDNVQDSVSKGRFVGAGVLRRKLSMEQAQAIRAAYVAGGHIKTLAATYGIHPKGIQDIIRGRTYRDAPIPPPAVPEPAGVQAQPISAVA